ncbi:hypothetical protein ACSZNZ_22190 [Aeromonas caviae]
MKYTISVLKHFISGHLSLQHTIYALHVRPVAVASRGMTWIVDPDFKM